MRKLGAWGLTALVLGLGTATVLAANGDDKAKTNAARSNWFSNWFGKDKPAVDKDELKKREAKKGDAKKEPEPGVPTVVETAAVVRERATQHLLRRLSVCDRLRQIAIDANDTELERRAEQFDERARQIYAQRTANPPAASAFESDEQTLDKHLGTTKKAEKSSFSLFSRNKSGKDRDSRAALKEESR